MSKACCDSNWLATVPDRTTASPMPSTVMSSFGSTCLSAERMPLRSRITAMSRLAICLPWASKMKTLVWPCLMPMM